MDLVGAQLALDAQVLAVDDARDLADGEARQKRRQQREARLGHSVEIAESLCPPILGTDRAAPLVGMLSGSAAVGPVGVVRHGGDADEQVAMAHHLGERERRDIRDIDDGKAVYMPVKAGQFSMHHERTIHGSMPNPSDRRRVGISFFYMPAHVRSTIGRRTATLVRGTDKYGHWDPEPMPKTDLDPVCMEFLRQSWSRYRDPDMPQAAKLKAS